MSRSIAKIHSCYLGLRDLMVTIEKRTVGGICDSLLAIVDFSNQGLPHIFPLPCGFGEAMLP